MGAPPPPPLGCLCRCLKDVRHNKHTFLSHVHAGNLPHTQTLSPGVRGASEVLWQRKVRGENRSEQAGPRATLFKRMIESYAASGCDASVSLVHPSPHASSMRERYAPSECDSSVPRVHPSLQVQSEKVTLPLGARPVYPAFTRACMQVP